MLPRLDPLRRCLKLIEWPEADRRAWNLALSSGDVFSDAGLASHWSPDTIHKYRRGYGRWLNWLQRSPGLIGDPADRVTHEATAAYLASLRAQALSDHTVVGRIAELKAVMAVIAPDHDWSWLRQLETRLRRRARGRDKRPHVVHPRQLVAAAMVRMDGLLAKRVMHRNDPMRFRDLLTVAILACRPIRRRNLGMMRLSQHLVRRGTNWWIQFEVHETKNRQPLAFELPAMLNAYLESYLERYRPDLLAGRFSDRLWITMFGRPMDGMSLYRRIVGVTPELCGKRLWPHLFRDGAATATAIEDPEHVGIVTDLLGHGSARTAERHYNQARMVESGRIYAKAVLGLRRRARRYADPRLKEDG